MKTPLLACLKTLPVACLLAACRSTSAPPAAPPKLDAIIDKTVHDVHLLGLAAVIVDHGKVVLDKGYGFTDLDHKMPITSDTVFAIGSLTKQFTAAAVLTLVDEGKLKLSDRAATFFSELPADVTIQQLLWQTSGLPEYAWGINTGKTADELIHFIATTPQMFPTGTQWAYSNSNYFVLGRIVELVARQPFSDYLRDHVLARAGLKATRVCTPATPQAKPSLAVGDAPQKGGDLMVDFYGAAGNICSTAKDLLRWQDALFGGKVLSPAGLAAMITPGKLTDGSATTYGSGLVIDHVGQHPRIWHNGGLPAGYESELTWYPDDKLQIVLLTNTGNQPPAVTLGKLEHELAVEQLHIVTPKPRDLALGSDALAAYVGAYKMESHEALVANVTVARNHLHVQIAGGVDDDLLAQGSGSFVLTKNPSVEYRFVGRGNLEGGGSLEVYKDGGKIATLKR